MARSEANDNNKYVSQVYVGMVAGVRNYGRNVFCLVLFTEHLCVFHPTRCNSWIFPQMTKQTETNTNRKSMHNA